MEIESRVNNHQEEELVKKNKTAKEVALKRLLLLLNCILLSVGSTGGPLILRLYFLHGGKRVWLSCWLETGGWPIMFIPLLFSYLHRKKRSTEKVKLFCITPFLFISGAVLGILTGLDDYIYANGLAKIPVSTSSLIISTQLVFTAGFAFFLVKQKFTSYSINAIVLLTLAAVVLGMHSNSDLPDGETNADYLTGFFLTLGAAVLYGFVLPMVEYTYMKSKRKITYTLVIETQLVMSFFATAFCTAGMLVNKDFQAIPIEARANPLGEANYYIVLVANAIIWQCFFLGAVGVIFCSSSLFSGILIAVLLPLVECLAVVFYHEKFTVEKGLSLALSLWGFVSYFYGEFKVSKELDQSVEFPKSSL